jgi:hypothetical protein
LPTTVSGEAACIWLLARGEAGWPTAVFSVLVDRAVGVLIFAIFVLFVDAQLIRSYRTRDYGNDWFRRPAWGNNVLVNWNQSPPVTKRWWIGRHLMGAARVAWRLCLSRAGALVAALSFVIQLVTAH